MAQAPFSGFHRLPLAERVQRVAAHAGLSQAEADVLKASMAPGSPLDAARADAMIENVVGVLQLPLGVATNFLINKREYLVPMAIEEPSVVAAAGHGAKLARAKGGFSATSSGQLMVGQVFLRGIKDADEAAEDIHRRKGEVLHAARIPDSSLERTGAGPIDLETRILRVGGEQVLAVHLIVDCKDAMGANAINARCEKVAPFLEKMTKGTATLRILSNLADRRLAHAKAVFAHGPLGGKKAVDRILHAANLAEADPYRCVTHNKGIMNGIDALAVATGNDWRAVEAGAHAYAAKNGAYEPLTRYHKDRNGDLVGEIELPLAMGIVGGATKANPMARVALKILGVRSAGELAEVAASVGLAQNLAALRALASEGIQQGHMRLHGRIARG
jgi:hydroxymethylglutaryl-CoA reductase